MSFLRDIFGIRKDIIESRKARAEYERIEQEKREKWILSELQKQREMLGLQEDGQRLARAEQEQLERQFGITRETEAKVRQIQKYVPDARKLREKVEAKEDKEIPGPAHGVNPYPFIMGGAAAAAAQQATKAKGWGWLNNGLISAALFLLLVGLSLLILRLVERRRQK